MQLQPQAQQRFAIYSCSFAGTVLLFDAHGGSDFVCGFLPVAKFDKSVALQRFNARNKIIIVLAGTPTLPRYTPTCNDLRATLVYHCQQQWKR